MISGTRDEVRDVMIGRDDVPLLADDEPAIDALGELSESKVNRGLVDDGRLDRAPLDHGPPPCARGEAALEDPRGASRF